MSSYLSAIPILLVVFMIIYSYKKHRKIAAIVAHRKLYKKENRNMKELAQSFIGKECLVYTVMSESSLVKGIIKEVTDSGMMIENDGNLQAVNLEYVTLIREWPRNANEKKKVFFS